MVLKWSVKRWWQRCELCTGLMRVLTVVFVVRWESGRVDDGFTVRAQTQVVFALVRPRQRTVVIQRSAHHLSLFYNQPFIIYKANYLNENTMHTVTINTYSKHLSHGRVSPSTNTLNIIHYLYTHHCVLGWFEKQILVFNWTLQYGKVPLNTSGIKQRFHKRTSSSIVQLMQSLRCKRYKNSIYQQSVKHIIYWSVIAIFNIIFYLLCIKWGKHEHLIWKKLSDHC